MERGTDAATRELARKWELRGGVMESSFQGVSKSRRLKGEEGQVRGQSPLPRGK